MAKIRVLIVDDAVVIRRLVSDCLATDPDIEVAATAASGPIALAKLDQVQPDIVTLDIEMELMDGLETLVAIRKKRPRLPVIMFSTLSERGASVTLDALALGANDRPTWAACRRPCSASARSSFPRSRFCVVVCPRRHPHPRSATRN
jgi:two-component system chemotaxis response regulator CheB